ncbi:hypothetical protein [Acetobacter ghanensis]|uniref:Uncharacterized protein n=1 Tax=Acetobacter ghanensis TaxID=431306 RepID=A0A0U5F8F5_9PROT|nr:hypothetical protein [Acetobacter ghanensis]NHO38622.1 hypothetical protein [Acetobacter ghanensis]GBQ50125.1 hypothetical protein AA18895_1844 [Acetobacter ghanensis DSM 18895]CEF55179.1 hypothetical protein AGA_1216 [Acetobacter ghanensis]
MTEIDPKELKILSDILALVLEDHPGQSDTALQALRNRARKNSTTGGALKNLFQTIATNPSKAKTASSRQTGSRASSSKSKTTDMPDQYRVQLREMADSITRLDRNLRVAYSQNETLKSELYLTQKSRAELQTHLATLQSSNRNQKPVTIAISLLVGLLVGIAGSQAVHMLWPPAPHVVVDNAHYLY